ncbi:MAG: methyltransferase [Flavobacteriaceae bacterium]|nr:methyltransferase [Flavobacteriaceae bacterium]
MNFISDKLQQYIDDHSMEESDLLKALDRETHQKVLQPRMLSGSYQGRLLALLAKMIGPKKILEVGTYTGYATLCMAEGLTTGGLIDTIDHNEELADIQRRYFDQSPYGSQIVQHLGEAKDILKTLAGPYDLVFLDADKENYPHYFDLIIDKLETGGILLSDNVLWSGKVLEKATDEATSALQEYNHKINTDVRVETIVLPIRDGLTITRKR